MIAMPKPGQRVTDGTREGTVMRSVVGIAGRVAAHVAWDSKPLLSVVDASTLSEIQCECCGMPAHLCWCYGESDDDSAAMEARDDNRNT